MGQTVVGFVDADFVRTAVAAATKTAYGRIRLDVAALAALTARTGTALRTYYYDAALDASNPSAAGQRRYFDAVSATPGINLRLGRVVESAPEWEAALAKAVAICGVDRREFARHFPIPVVRTTVGLSELMCVDVVALGLAGRIDEVVLFSAGPGLAEAARVVASAGVRVVVVTSAALELDAALAGVADEVVTLDATALSVLATGGASAPVASPEDSATPNARPVRPGKKAVRVAATEPVEASDLPAASEVIPLARLGAAVDASTDLRESAFVVELTPDTDQTVVSTATPTHEDANDDDTTEDENEGTTEAEAEEVEVEVETAEETAAPQKVSPPADKVFARNPEPGPVKKAVDATTDTHDVPSVQSFPEAPPATAPSGYSPRQPRAEVLERPHTSPSVPELVQTDVTPPVLVSSPMETIQAQTKLAGETKAEVPDAAPVEIDDATETASPREPEKENEPEVPDEAFVDAPPATFAAVRPTPFTALAPPAFAAPRTPTPTPDSVPAAAPTPPPPAPVPDYRPEAAAEADTDLAGDLFADDSDTSLNDEAETVVDELFGPTESTPDYIVPPVADVAGELFGDDPDDMSGELFGDDSEEPDDMSGELFGDDDTSAADMSDELFGDDTPPMPPPPPASATIAPAPTPPAAAFPWLAGVSIPTAQTAFGRNPNASKN